MSRRAHHLPWRAAGANAERQSVADVLQTTGWAFSRIGDGDIAAFVASGERDAQSLLAAFGLDLPAESSVVEIGAGIGRMTAPFTRRFERVIAADLDAAFLERCRETVTRFGVPAHLSTVHVADGRTLVMPDRSADLVFSSFTLQHCPPDEAIDLTREAIRVAKTGGRVALHYRSWGPADVLLGPLSRIVRGLWKVPAIGRHLAHHPTMARIGWQAVRLNPRQVLAEVGESLGEVRVFHAPGRAPDLPGLSTGELPDAHPRHWWLVATVGEALSPTGGR